MGNLVSKAANGVGGFIGSAFAAPFKAIFNGSSCQEVCSGPWDLVCFVEHLCVSHLVKLLLILGLCYLLVLFLYLLFKVGICQCIVRSLCKMCWAACETYWFALEDITCFLWYKLKNTERRRRRRRRPRRRLLDVEGGYSTSTNTWSSESDVSEDDNRHHSSRVGMKRKSTTREGWDNINQTHGGHRHHDHHHITLKSREVSVHVKAKRRVSNPRRARARGRGRSEQYGISKRRRVT